MSFLRHPGARRVRRTGRRLGCPPAAGEPLGRALIMLPPECAGRFYPADAARLAETVDRLLAEVPTPTADEAPPVALVVPHAGYISSGRVAATAYRRLAEQR